MSNATNQDIRQKRCTMMTTTAIRNNYDNTVRGGTPDVDKVVAIDSDGKVDIIATNEEVFGKLDSLADDGFASIIDEGYVDLPTDGTTITYGSGLVGGATAGTVKTGTSKKCVAICSAGANKVRAKLW